MSTVLEAEVRVQGSESSEWEGFILLHFLIYFSVSVMSIILILPLLANSMTVPSSYVLEYKLNRFFLFNSHMTIM